MLGQSKSRTKRENQRRKQLVSWPWIKKLRGHATAVRTKTMLSASARASLRERADNLGKSAPKPVFLVINTIIHNFLAGGHVTSTLPGKFPAFPPPQTKLLLCNENCFGPPSARCEPGSHSEKNQKKPFYIHFFGKTTAFM